MRSAVSLGLGLAVCGLLAVAGCKSPNLKDRMDDSAEILRCNVGWGPGLLVNAHVTRCLALGAGAYDARRFGFRNGHGWIWDERRYDTNLVIPIWGWEDVDSVYYGGMPVTPIRGDDLDRLPPGEDPGGLRWAQMPLTLNDRNRGWLEVSANAHLIWVGIDLGLDVGELVDYLLGWVGVDLAGDDCWTGKHVERHDPPPVPPGPGPHADILK
jgi:hypothetical protein